MSIPPSSAGRKRSRSRRSTTWGRRPTGRREPAGWTPAPRKAPGEIIGAGFSRVEVEVTHTYTVPAFTKLTHTRGRGQPSAPVALAEHVDDRHRDRLGDGRPG